MSINVDVDVDVDVWCSVCTNSIDNEDDIICKKCYTERIKNLKSDNEILMHKLESLFNEAVISKSITVSGEDALFIKDSIRQSFNIT
jgi:hypothetical protein